MRLQLASGYAAQIGTYTNMKEAATAILAVFAADAHDPFTRSDIVQVLRAMDGVNDDKFEAVEDSLPAWKHLNAVLTEATTKAPGRGQFTQGSRATVAGKVATAVENGDVMILSKAGVPWQPKALDYDEEDLGFYLNDPGLRRIAVSTTKCFGYYLKSAAACQACPLAAFCAEARMGVLGEAASRLDRETEEALALALKGEEVEEPPAEEAEAPSGTDPSTMCTEEVMTLPFEGVCSGCNKVIPEGDQGIYIEGKGLLHPDCS